MLERFKLQDKKTKNYFEGWYVRVTDITNDFNFAFIFAKTLDETDPHAFIQIVNGTTGKNTYLRFDLNQFTYANETVTISSHSLSANKVIINHTEVKVNITLSDHDALKQKSAMGILRKMPLECYQEIIYMKAVAKGIVSFKGIKSHLTGTSYMEKTYGNRFPKSWFWLQANHFEKHNLKLSLAGGHVPTLKLRPFGFFAIVHHDDTVYRFATYNMASFKYVKKDNQVSIRIRRKNMVLMLDIHAHRPIKLVGPIDDGKMMLDVYESLTSTVQLTLKQGQTVLVKDHSSYAGFEWMHEDIIK